MRFLTFSVALVLVGLCATTTEAQLFRANRSWGASYSGTGLESSKLVGYKQPGYRGYSNYSYAGPMQRSHHFGQGRHRFRSVISEDCPCENGGTIVSPGSEADSAFPSAPYIPKTDEKSQFVKPEVPGTVIPQEPTVVVPPLPKKPIVETPEIPPAPPTAPTPPPKAAEPAPQVPTLASPPVAPPPAAVPPLQEKKPQASPVIEVPATPAPTNGFLPPPVIEEEAVPEEMIIEEEEEEDPFQTDSADTTPAPLLIEEDEEIVAPEETAEDPFGALEAEPAESVEEPAESVEETEAADETEEDPFTFEEAEEEIAEPAETTSSEEAATSDEAGSSDESTTEDEDDDPFK